MKLHIAMVLRQGHRSWRANKAHVVLFPELFDGGYSALRNGEGIHTPGDGFLERFRMDSKAHRRVVVSGSLPLRGPRGTLTNTSMVYRNGKLLHRYDKIHLFGPGGDTRYFEAGVGNGVFSFRVGNRRVNGGVIICYDLRFPELTRMLARDGLQVLFVPARWPQVRDDAWQTLLKARAIENQIFVVGCNAWGKEGGYSYIFDPLGKTVVNTRENPEIPLLDATLDLDIIRRSHMLHENLRDAVLLQQTRFPVAVKSPRRRGTRGSRRISAGS